MVFGQRHSGLPSLSWAGKRIFKDILEQRKVSDLHLASLKILFGKHVQKAASIVDQGGVVCYIGSTSGRRVYQVQGRRLREHYTVFPDNYCSCQSFFYDIATKSEGVFCKHQLAVFLSDALDKTTFKTVDELVLAEILVDLSQ